MTANELIQVLLGVPPASQVVAEAVAAGEAEGIILEARPNAAPLVVLHLLASSGTVR